MSNVKWCFIGPHSVQQFNFLFVPDCKSIVIQAITDQNNFSIQIYYTQFGISSVAVITNSTQMGMTNKNRATLPWPVTENKEVHFAINESIGPSPTQWALGELIGRIRPSWDLYRRPHRKWFADKTILLFHVWIGAYTDDGYPFDAHCCHKVQL